MPSLRSRRVRFVGGVGVIALAANTLTACYTQAPVDLSMSAPANAEVAVEISDRGRYELGGSIGESPRIVEGRLVSASDSALTVAVRNVIAIGGGRTQWAGERVQIRRTGVSQVSERKLSRSRSFLAAAAVVAGVVAVFVTTALIGGGGSGDGPTDRPPPTGET
jgi:hypothetical protein